MLSLPKLLLLLQAIAVSVNGHKILGLFIHPGASHFDSFYPIMNALAEKGHDVTVLTYSRVKDPHPNYHQFILGGTALINSSLGFDMMHTPSRSLYAVYNEFFELYKWGEMSCEDAFKSPHLDTILESHHQKPFDLALTEVFDTDCTLGIIHNMSVPHIGLSSCILFPWHFDRVNLPDIPSYVPVHFFAHSRDMNLLERTQNWLIFKTMKMLYRLVQIADNRIVRQKFGDNVPDVADLANDISLLLVNQHYSLAGPKPLSTQVIEIGGIHVKDERPLPENLRTLLNAAKQGAILVSWGGNINASSLSTETVREILNGLARLPQQIIWKWEDDTLAGKLPKNVFIQKWLPQRDILGHPNVRAFWSHGGNLGTIEAVHCGVPVVVTPIYGDQFANGAALVDRGMGVVLPFEDITEENVYTTIRKALEPSYRQNAQTVSYSHRNRPLSPIAESVWWVEHVLATSGAGLAKSKTYEMSSLAYYSLDAVLLLSSIVLVLLWLVYFIVSRCCCRRKAANQISAKKGKKQKSS